MLIGYVDNHGASTERIVDPLGLDGGQAHRARPPQRGDPYLRRAPHHHRHPGGDRRQRDRDALPVERPALHRPGGRGRPGPHGRGVGLGRLLPLGPPPLGRRAGRARPVGAARGDRPGHRADAAGHDGHAALATATVGGRQAPGHPRPPVRWARGARRGSRRAARPRLRRLRGRGRRPGARPRSSTRRSTWSPAWSGTAAPSSTAPTTRCTRPYGRCPCSGPACRSGWPASPRTGARWSGRAGGTGTCRSGAASRPTSSRRTSASTRGRSGTWSCRGPTASLPRSTPTPGSPGWCSPRGRRTTAGCEELRHLAAAGPTG